MSESKILITGGAGLVGQNLVHQLVASGYGNIVVLDKNPTNLEILQSCQPNVLCQRADLSVEGDWERTFEGVDIVVMLQAQIGGNDPDLFVKNNEDSTRLVLKQIKRYQISQLIHVSSSVVNSMADDFYTRSKSNQEELVLAEGIPATILRPTLMFGWFDRKHLGWLKRFMDRVPVFPIPGNGKYMRQPLYVRDFCRVICSCIEKGGPAGIFDISGHEKIDYIDIIRTIKRSTGSKTFVVKIPYALFYALLWVWALFDKNPPFTVHQLAALVCPDEFEVIDWPSIFNVPITPFEDAVSETFNSKEYSDIELEF